MTPIRTVVVGGGHFGRYHVEKYAALPDAELVAVVERDPAAASTQCSRLRVNRP
jgi:predicted dehydrogenase